MSCDLKKKAIVALISKLVEKDAIIMERTIKIDTLRKEVEEKYGIITEGTKEIDKQRGEMEEKKLRT